MYIRIWYFGYFYTNLVPSAPFARITSILELISVARARAPDIMYIYNDNNKCDSK